MLAWLRHNLSFTMMVVSALSGVTGAIVSATWRVAQYDYKIETDERARILLAEDVHQLEDDEKELKKDLEQRRQKYIAQMALLEERVALLEATAKQLSLIATRADDIDGRQSATATRTAVLETQIKFLGDYLQSNLRGRK